ncbi:MAG: 4-hydroxy-tetrahydrodipicolinate reductase [Bacteroidales bacterium]|jgi:4-hydroxy-tetrahydrodipicolinate reductase|nr:4-hydroxy-tetrahydrodipicolinate reductase [Bacteroidales bacterium]
MKIALIGYGKMGKAIEEIATSRKHKIVCVIDIGNQKDFDSPAFQSADVAIEFTVPAAAMANYRQCFMHHIPVVAGTTGWLEHLQEIRSICEREKQTFFYASNYSLGVNIFFALNDYLSKIMNNYPAYDVTMEEAHHIHKLDSPSGTAISLAETIVKNIDRKKTWNESEKIMDDVLQITSFRRGETPGLHAIKYDSQADTITITHNAKNRRGFALGAVLAAEFACNRKGFLGMKDLLKF